MAGLKTENSTELKRSLKERHMSMIAIGGTIGTGLFVGSGAALAASGPGGTLIAYAIMGIMVFFVMTSLGELATYMPISGSFNSYGSRFIDPAIGFALGWNYWFSWTVTVGTELVAAGIIIKYWLPGVNPTVWSAVAMLIMFLLNAFVVEVYGEAEYWFSMIKVITVVIFIIIGIFVDAGVLGGHKYAFENWCYNKAPFVDGFVGILNTFLVAGFSFQGTEIVGVTAGESKNPTRDVPKAIRNVFWRILLFYILAIFVMGLLIPYDADELVTAGNDNIGASPFTLVFVKAGLRPAAHVMNAVILVTILSAGNSGLYVSTRILWVLANDGKAPRFLGRVTKGGIPIWSLVVTSVVAIFCFCMSLVGEGQAYIWLLNLSGITGFFGWMGIAASHWRFRRAYLAQGYSLNELPYKALLYPFGPIFSFVMLLFIVFGQGYQVFKDFDVATFFASYVCIPLFIVVWAFWKIFKKTKVVPLMEIDLLTGARQFETGELDPEAIINGTENIELSEKDQAKMGVVHLQQHDDMLDSNINGHNNNVQMPQPKFN
ncbi:lysine-specific permease [Ramicandelaber brevisporus]|nr:lysine-specific permease [Ramicandelaber brevisporus]